MRESELLAAADVPVGRKRQADVKRGVGEEQSPSDLTQSLF